MAFVVDFENGQSFRINLDRNSIPPENLERVINSEVDKAERGLPSSASGPLTPSELQDITADPGEVTGTLTPLKPQRQLSGAEIFGAVAIPTAMSAAGTMIGGALGGPVGAAVGETLLDTLGFFTNVAAGLEPFSVTQLGLSLATPFVSRATLGLGVQGAQAIGGKTKAARFAVQEANRLEARRIKQNIILLQETLDATFPEENITRAARRRDDLIQIAEDTQKRAENLIDVQTSKATTRFNSQKQKLLPVVDEETVEKMYEQVNRVHFGTVPLKILQETQKKLNKKLRGVGNVIPALVDSTIALTAKAKKGTATFQDVRNTIVQLGQRQASLAVARTPDAAEQRFIIAQLRDSLEETFEAAANSNRIAPEARDLLKKANSFNFKNRTADELTYFLARFTDNTRQPPTVDFASALQAFRDVRNKEAQLLRSRLRDKRIGVDTAVDKFLDQARKIQARPVEILEEAKANVRAAKKLGIPERATLPRQPSLVQFTDPPDAIQKTSPATIFWAAIGGLSVGGLAFSQGAGPEGSGVIASALTAPWAISRMMMTPWGQKQMLKLLDASGSLFDQRVAGSVGAMLRATMAQASNSSLAGGQGQQEPSLGTEQSP